MKLIVPETLADITLRQYQRYQKEIDYAKDMPNQMEYLNIKKIEVFCNLSQTEVFNIEVGDLFEIAEKIEVILQTESELIQKFKLNGINFGWVPELDRLSYGEFLDLNGNISDWSTMHIAMGVLYRPIKNEASGGLYTVEKYKGDKYHKDLLDMPMDAVIGSMVFFWNLGMDLATSIIKCLTEEEKENPQNLAENGIGIAQSMSSLTTILQNLKVLRN